MILRRGKQPSAIDCFMQENVAVVIARLAINAATLAISTTGQKAPSAFHIMSTFSMANLLKIIQEVTNSTISE